jgi:hypothetical protein
LWLRNQVYLIGLWYYLALKMLIAFFLRRWRKYLEHIWTNYWNFLLMTWMFIVWLGRSISSIFYYQYVLMRLREINLKLNPNKCEFAKIHLIFLGHVISCDNT